MKKIFLLTSIVVICGLNLFAQSSLTKEEYAVYASVLRNIRLQDLENSKTEFSFVILDSTSFNSNVFDEYAAKRFRGLLRDFNRKNLTASKLDKLLPTKYEYEVVNESEIKELLRIGAEEYERVQAEYKRCNIGITWGGSIVWKPFHENFLNSNGYYQFSRVGFSANKKFALVTVEGKGAFWDNSMQYILRKVKGRWRIHLSGGSFGVA